MRPRPRLFAPNARSVRLALSMPWPTANVRAFGAAPQSGNAVASSVSGASQPDFFGRSVAVAALADDPPVVPLDLGDVVVGVVAVLVGEPSVQGNGFQGSFCVLV